MSASNYNWVCFKCHLVTRQAKTAAHIPKCLNCKLDLFCLGYKVEVPKKDDLRGWRKLRDDCRLLETQRLEKEAMEKSNRIRAAKLRIAELEKLPENKDRSRLIEEIKKTIHVAF